MKKWIIITFILGILGMLIAAYAGVLNLPIQDKNKALLKALNQNKLERFEALLKEGANPNSIFGDDSNQWVMCAATDKGKLEFLKLAIQYGGNINLRLPTPIEDYMNTTSSAPVLCSIRLRNYEVFNYLLSLGVKLDIREDELAKPNPKSEHIKKELWGKTMYGTPLNTAFTLNEFKMAYDILQKKKPNWEEKLHIDISLSGTFIDKQSDANKWRLKIIEFLKKEGYKIDPDKRHREFLKRRAKELDNSSQ